MNSTINNQIRAIQDVRRALTYLVKDKRMTVQKHDKLSAELNDAASTLAALKITKSVFDQTSVIDKITLEKRDKIAVDFFYQNF